MKDRRSRFVRRGKGSLLLLGLVPNCSFHRQLLNALYFNHVTGHAQQQQCTPISCLVINGAERYDVVNITQVENNIISKQIYTVKFKS